MDNLPMLQYLKGLLETREWIVICGISNLTGCIVSGRIEESWTKRPTELDVQVKLRKWLVPSSTIKG